jgi:FKBP-type peptidyl-prolyl cis-trans isomerase FklB
MKNTIYYLFAFCLCFSLQSHDASGQKKKKGKEPIPAPFTLNNSLDSLSYGLGMALGTSMKKGGIDQLNYESFLKAIEDAYKGVDSIMDPESANMFISEHLQNQQKVKAGLNKSDGIAFLEANKSKEGVITTASGLQYKVIKTGTGKTPNATDNVTVHYHGMLIDGTVFDSSVERNEPIQLPVSGVIEGWTEALQLMKEGDKWILYVPSELAYGENPMPGGPIQPNSVLVFEVELISVDE